MAFCSHSRLFLMSRKQQGRQWATWFSWNLSIVVSTIHRYSNNGLGSTATQRTKTTRSKALSYRWTSQLIPIKTPYSHINISSNCSHTRVRWVQLRKCSKCSVVVQQQQILWLSLYLLVLGTKFKIKARAMSTLKSISSPRQRPNKAWPNPWISMIKLIKHNRDSQATSVKSCQMHQLSIILAQHSRVSSKTSL